MGIISSEHADDLFRRGEFLNFIQAAASHVEGDPKRTARRHLRLAEAFALTGNLSKAVEIAIRYSDARREAAIRAQAEYILAISAWRAGNASDASKLFAAALRNAGESKNPQCIAWAHLHTFRFYVDFHPSDAVSAILPSTRKAVIAAGDRQATAYLHSCVSVFEGQKGRMNEAWRHCAMAEDLLADDPNAWILGATLLNKGCLYALRCDFKKAEDQLIAAQEAYARSGNPSAMATGSLAYLQLQTGQLVEARRALASIIGDPSLAETRKTPLRETLARVHLVLNELDECAIQLATLLERSPGDGEIPGYVARWAEVTYARMLSRRGRIPDALRVLVETENRNSGDDSHFAAALNLAMSQLLMANGQRTEATRRLSLADEAGITGRNDLQAQYYYACAGMVDTPSLSDQLKSRALRLWATQGLITPRLEIGDGTGTIQETRHELVAARRGEPVIPATRASVASALAACFDLVEHPFLLARELAATMQAVGCATDAEVLDLSKTHQPFVRDACVFRIGDDNARYAVRWRLPVDPEKAILIADIVRIGRAAVELERARQAERSRAALWPSEPIEDQVGALFVAEEMQTLLYTARRIAAANIPVLITGETGTGKEVLARLIHGYSPRAGRTFLPFNCSATPREMLDAQLFGHRKGAFTGASENFAGVIRAAAGGTLFLDEIGESTLDIQPKLLRFLESGEVHPIGETHPQRVDVRVLAATNADVDALVAQGRFREDLFYRLNIVRLHIPPLRERRVEIPAFANHYLQKFAREMGRSELRLSEETMEYLILYRWPGNVRQVANEMRRLAALAEPGAVLMPEHLSADIAASRRTVPASERPLGPTEILVRTDQPLGAAIQHLERAMLGSALASTSSVDEAAKLLGLSRKGLYLKRLRYGMEIDRPRSGTEVA